MRTLLFLLPLLIATTLSAQNHKGKQKDIDQILTNASAFSGYVMAGDIDGILESYTADGKIFPYNRPIMEGRAALDKYWRPVEGYTTTHHLLTPIEIVVKGKEARDYGKYEGRSKGPDGVEHAWQGKYVVIWRKDAGKWRMYLDIWTASPAE